MTEQPEQRRILVVGGSGGIGAAVCRELAAPGIALTVHGGHDGQKLRDLGDSLRARGCYINEILRAIAGPDDALEVLALAGPVDILVVSYGPYEEWPLRGADPAAMRRMMDLNYLVPAALISAVLPAMMDQRYGRILVFGTTGSERIRGARKCAGYVAAKAALASLVKSVAAQSADVDVMCNMICPGYVATEYHTTKQISEYDRRMPSGSAQTPESIAALARWLLSDENVAVNGAIVSADSGL